MNKTFKKVPVYTRDSVFIKGDDKKKQKIIDEWTDKLATKMATMSSDKALIDEFGIQIERRERRGGHNRKTVEMLNEEGYVTKIFHSVHDAAECYGTSDETIQRICRGRKSGLLSGVILRYRETEKERTARKKAEAKKKAKKKLK
jgi:hypothetical protein